MQQPLKNTKQTIQTKSETRYQIPKPKTQIQTEAKTETENDIEPETKNK